MLVTEHGEALTYDLLTVGMRLRDLGTDALTWEELLAVVRQQPQDSALGRAVHGADVAWGLPEQLLAAIADTLAMQFWADHNRRKAHKPKPIERPGVTETETAVFGNADSAMTIEDFDLWLGREYLN